MPRAPREDGQESAERAAHEIRDHEDSVDAVACLRNQPIDARLIGDQIGLRAEIQNMPPMASPVNIPPTVHSKPNAIIPINKAHPDASRFCNSCLGKAIYGQSRSRKIRPTQQRALTKTESLGQTRRGIRIRGRLLDF